MHLLLVQDGALSRLLRLTLSFKPPRAKHGELLVSWFKRYSRRRNADILPHLITRLLCGHLNGIVSNAGCSLVVHIRWFMQGRS